MQKTVCAVDLGAIVSNALFVRRKIGNRFFFAVVKADAYGHGAQETALALEKIADGFCVSIVDEGAALRLAGISKPILVFTPPLGKDDALRASYYGLTLTVSDLSSARYAAGLPCHIKINTGMNRFGVNAEDLGEVLSRVDPALIEGVYSHLFDPVSKENSAAQLSRFLEAAAEVKRVSPGAVAHIAASGGILSGGEYLLDGVRAGILLYGYAPQGFSADVKPAMKVYARLAQKTAFCGGGVGYARAEREYGELYAYRAGYADGFSRTTPLGIGNLCMDSFISEEGGDLRLIMDDAEKIAAKRGTISYEVLCSASRRAERIYG